MDEMHNAAAIEFRLFSVQAVMFTPTCGDGFRPAGVLAPVLTKFPDRYDKVDSSMGFNLPETGIEIPPGGAVRIMLSPPSVTLASTDGRWTYKANSERADSIWLAKSDDDGRRELNTVCQQCIQPLIEYPANSSDLQVSRISLVVRRWFQTADAANRLASQFCKTEMVDPGITTAPLRHSQTFRLDNHKKYSSSLGVGDVNSWMRCFNNVIEEQVGISVEQDINTVTEDGDTKVFTVEQIQEFFRWVPDEMGRIIKLYFPQTN